MTDKKISTKWYKGLKSSDTEGKAIRKKLVLGAEPALTVLQAMIEADIEELQRARDKDENFDSGSYSELQANYSGKINSLRKYLTVVSL